MGARLNGIIFYDLERLLTRVSRSLMYTYKSNISNTVRFRDKVALSLRFNGHFQVNLG